MCLVPQKSFAGAHDRVVFEVKPKVISRIVKKTPGETKLLIASNTAFRIRAEHLIGEIKVKIQAQGQVSNVNFGQSAQIPGAVNDNSLIISSSDATIYTSDRKTASRRGTLDDQSVLVSVLYDSIASPEFSVKPLK